MQGSLLPLQVFHLALNLLLLVRPLLLILLKHLLHFLRIEAAGRLISLLAKLLHIDPLQGLLDLVLQPGGIDPGNLVANLIGESIGIRRLVVR